MPGAQRRFLGYLIGLALVCLLAQGVTGVSELALYLTPAFLLAALLLSGRYLGEDAIVRRRAALSVAHHVRRERPAWPRIPQLPLASLLARSPRSQRGPPALALS